MADQQNLEQQIAAIRAEQASANLIKAADRFTAQLNNVTKLKMDFFDRLIVLDGGTIALSLTVVGMLAKGGQHVTHCQSFLFISWICFVVSLIAAILRNWHEPDRLAAAEVASLTAAVAENYEATVLQAKSLGVTAPAGMGLEVAEEGKSYVKTQMANQVRHGIASKVTGGIALTATVLGYILLLCFVAANRWSLV